MQQCSEEKVGTFMLHGNPLERRDKVVCLGGPPGLQPSSLPVTVAEVVEAQNLPRPDRHLASLAQIKYRVEDYLESQGRDGKNDLGKKPYFWMLGEIASHFT